MKPSEILRKAAGILSEPGAWGQGDYARDAKGAIIDTIEAGDPLPPEAVCFCAAGAIWKAGGKGWSKLDASCLYLQGVLDTHDAYEPIASWNDAEGRTAEDVVAKMLEAAAKAESEGQ
jgi:hypothetical protein